MTSVWNDFGFRESPYATDHLPPSSEGRAAARGPRRRTAGATSVSTFVRAPSHTRGRERRRQTSLVNVAGFQAQREFEEQKTEQLLIALERPFQLSNTDDAQSFRRTVFFEVARGFIRNHDVLKGAGLDVPDVWRHRHLAQHPCDPRRWRRVSVAGFGGSGSRTQAPNTSAGFSEAGFDAAVDRWLRDAFPSRQAGGFLCVVDNLELLETSQNARQLLESMRDSVLSQPGLRWVLCGARGIVRTGASSPRPEGTLAEPLILRPIPDEIVAEVIARRIEVFRGRVTPDAYAPVEPRGFQHIYEILHANLRNSLRFCEDFAFWLHGEGSPPESSDDRYQLSRSGSARQPTATRRTPPPSGGARGASSTTSSA